MTSPEKPKNHSVMPLSKMADWYNRVWALSSVLYESVPANKAGAFFAHVQEMFEISIPRELFKDIGVFHCVTGIGLYCRILCQLKSYKKPEFEDSVSSIINTDYGAGKIYVVAGDAAKIAEEIGYSIERDIEYEISLSAEEKEAFHGSLVIYYFIEKILQNHTFTNPTQLAALEFYHSILRFVIYSGMPDHRLVPAYVTTKLAKLLNLILSHPVTLTIPEADDLWGRECLNDRAPDFTEKHRIHTDFSLDSSLTAASIQDLLDQLRSRGFTIEVAQEEIARDIANQAKKDPTVRDKLLKWVQSLADETASDIVKEVVKLAIRYLGIPIP